MRVTFESGITTQRNRALPIRVLLASMPRLCVLIPDVVRSRIQTARITDFGALGTANIDRPNARYRAPLSGAVDHLADVVTARSHGAPCQVCGGPPRAGTVGSVRRTLRVPALS
jgi:hypothetical protein